MKQPFLIFSFCAILLISCGGSRDNEGAAGSTATDTAPGVITTPPHDTSAVVTPPPTHDSNAVVTDSQGMSR